MLNDTNPIGPKRNREKTVPLSNGYGEGARRQMDELLIEIWEDRFRGQSKQIEELTQTVRGYNGTPGVMERLGKIETNQENQNKMIADQSKTIDAIHLLLTPKQEEDKKGLTKDQLAAMVLGLAKPIITAVIIWVLLTLFPQLLVHLGTP